MKTSCNLLIISILNLCLLNNVFAHGDGAPQPVDTEGLEALGEEWLTKNPYKGNELAIQIGASGYGSNCARCHGLDARSGGIAPDLRALKDTAEDDEWFIYRARGGSIRNGVTYMPRFEGLISQEAMWAIRTYINSLPKDGL